MWLTVLASCTLFFLSCVEDTGDGDPSDKRLATILLNLNTPLLGDDDTADSSISSLRMLVYDSESGDLELNTPFEQIPTGGKTVALEVPVGIHDFVFIANEDSDPDLKEQLTSIANAAIYNISKLNDLSFARSAFDADNDIPMATLIEGVEITIDNTLIVPGVAAPITDIWNVDIERVAIRIRMTITTPEGQFGKWVQPQSIVISGIPERAFLLPGFDNGENRIAQGEAFTASVTVDSAPGFISEVDADGNVTTTFDRLILPELYLSGANNIEGNALGISMDFGDNIKTGQVYALEQYGLGFGLPRNTYLDLEVNVRQDFLEVTGTVLPWEEAPLENKDLGGQYELTVDRTEYFFGSHGGPQPVNVKTDYPDGWTIEQDDIAWDHTTPTVANNNITMSEYTTGTALRTGTFTVRAGNMSKTIRVTQFPPAGALVDQLIPNSYVGAFWKADQTGERLVNNASVPDTGDWMAIVVEGEEWIHLDTRMTADNNVGWRAGASEADVANGNDPGFDNIHFVSGNLKYVKGTVDSGNPGIYFRIGLNSRYIPTPDAPVRYGVVILSYANNTKMQRIWIRQGEGADFLMRRTDPSAGDYVSPNRPAAVPFSPYNLTAETLNTQAGMNGQGPNPGIFTDYPSMVGAYWQWASLDNPRYAWDPYSPTAPNWSIVNEDNIWSALKAKHETCPEGYRRPSEGPIDAYVGTEPSFSYTYEALLQSEIRQSLLLAPTMSGWWPFTYNTNYVKGYYADGFFDRRAIKYDPETLVNAVSIDNRNIASSGGLFFNQATSASLFLPQVGRREGDYTYSPDNAAVGKLEDPSLDDVYYWSSSAQRLGVAWSFMGYPMMSCGLAIRCVKDGEP